MRYGKPMCVRPVFDDKGYQIGYELIDSPIIDIINMLDDLKDQEDCEGCRECISTIQDMIKEYDYGNDK